MWCKAHAPKVRAPCTLGGCKADFRDGKCTRKWCMHQRRKVHASKCMHLAPKKMRIFPNKMQVSGCIFSGRCKRPRCMHPAPQKVQVAACVFTCARLNRHAHPRFLRLGRDHVCFAREARTFLGARCMHRRCTCLACIDASRCLHFSGLAPAPF